ncbi:MAG: hypothetical protein ACOX3T_00265 [Bdellovibrionota bacterium]
MKDISSVKKLINVDISKEAVLKSYKEVLREEAIREKLLEICDDFEIPQIMLDNEIDNILKDYGKSVISSLKQMGGEFYKEKARKEFNSLAKERLRLSYLVNNIIQNENICVDDASYEAFLKEIASSKWVSIDNFKKNITARNLEEIMISRFKEEKVLDWIFEKADITFVDVKEEMKKNLDNNEDDDMINFLGPIVLSAVRGGALATLS